MSLNGVKRPLNYFVMDGRMDGQTDQLTNQKLAYRGL